MKIRTLVPAAAALVVLAGWLVPAAWAQTQDKEGRIRVTLPYAVKVGEKTLPPGEYTIEQLPGLGDSPVLMISDGHGLKVQTMAMTVRTVDLNSPKSSWVTLYHLGKSYYLDKVWLEGDPYGYRVLLPESVRNREKEMESVTVPAR